MCQQKVDLPAIIVSSNSSVVHSSLSVFRLKPSESKYGVLFRIFTRHHLIKGAFTLHIADSAKCRK